MGEKIRFISVFCQHIFSGFAIGRNPDGGVLKLNLFSLLLSLSTESHHHLWSDQPFWWGVVYYRCPRWAARLLREGIWQRTQINNQTKKHEIANITQQNYIWGSTAFNTGIQLQITTSN
jgi:hypothetical protein